MALGGRAWRGYFPIGGELTSGTPDLKEGLYFGAKLDDDHPLVRAGTPMHGRNLFPSRIPLFRETVLDYMAAMTVLGHRLMEGIALSLGLEASYFADRYTKDQLVLFRISHYPCDTRPAENKPRWGVGEHTDYGVLTILKQDDAKGLQVKSRSRWIAARPIAGTFLCNIGDMLDRMTGGRVSLDATPGVESDRVSAGQGIEGLSGPGTVRVMTRATDRAVRRSRLPVLPPHGTSIARHGRIHDL